MQTSDSGAPTLYSSLVGPLLNLYYPLPFDNELHARAALNSSSLKNLWCSIYTADQARNAVKKYGGQLLPPVCAAHLDYNIDAVITA